MMYIRKRNLTQKVLLSSHLRWYYKIKAITVSCKYLSLFPAKIMKWEKEGKYSITLQYETGCITINYNCSFVNFFTVVWMRQHNSITGQTVKDDKTRFR